MRSFKDEPVSDETIEKILKAATWAPSAGNRQAWEFVVVKDQKTKEKLVRGALGQAFIAAAPVVIVVGANRRRSAQRYGDRGRTLYCLLDAAVATQNLLLAAYGLGLGTCWIGAFKDDVVADIVGFPSYIRPVAIVPLGKPAREPSAPSRYPLQEVVHDTRFSE